MPERQTITSLVGVAAPLLTVDTSAPAAIEQTSQHLPRMWLKATPFVFDELPLTSTTNPDIGLEGSYELPKLSTLVSNIVLRVVSVPLTVVPLGAPVNYVDFPAWAMIEYFRTVFGANQVYNSEAYDFYFKFAEDLNIEKRTATEDLTMGNSTTAVRTAAVTAATEWYAPLFQPYESDPSESLPLVTFSQKTRFLLKTVPLAQILINPTNAAVSKPNNAPFDFSLILTVIHTTGDEGAMLLQMSQNDDGVSYMIHQNVRQESDEFANKTNGYVANSKMSGITKPIKILRWALVPTKLVNNTGRNDRFFFNPQPPPPIPAGMTPYNPIISWSISANGQLIQRPIFNRFNRVYQYMLYCIGLVGESIFFSRYTTVPHSHNAALGYLDYTNLNNPTLSITFGTNGTGDDPDTPANPQSLRLIYNALDYNFWFMKSGNWSRAFN